MSEKDDCWLPAAGRQLVFRGMDSYLRLAWRYGVVTGGGETRVVGGRRSPEAM